MSAVDSVTVIRRKEKRPAAILMAVIKTQKKDGGEEASRDAE